MAKWRSIPAVWTAVPLFLLFFWLALSGLALDSPTMDEQNHLARGIAFVRTGDPRLSLEHPPLINSLSALPLLTLPNVTLPLDDPSWTELSPPDVYWYVFADQFMWHVDNDVTQMIFLGRLPIIFMLLGLGLVGYHFARELWGRPSALLALLLLLFEPNLLAHGRLITTDFGGTTFLFLAAYLLWRMWQVEGWSWPHWLAVGAAMGLAFSSKLSMLGFVPVFLLLAVLPLYPGGWRGAGRRLGQIISGGGAAVFVVWALFGFEWRPFRFPSAQMQFLNGISGPMPTFWAGIDQIFNVSRGGRAAFLLGEFSDQGFPLYFPIAFLVKTPLAILIALPIAALILLWYKPTRRNALFLLIPAFYYFSLSMWSGINIGYRHLLPMLPFLLVLIGGVASLKVVSGGRLVLFGVVVLLLVETLTVRPHYLSFFNWVVGGPQAGANLLADSNIDWGQDLRRLQDWMAENDVEVVKLGWFGTADPAYYGLNYEPLPGFPRAEFLSLWAEPPFDPADPEPGIYAISASSLWESHWGQKTIYPWFRQREPDARVGYSILIYEVEG
ncbi:MAG: phospholipid carrier-dependent glycosyltransferase [Chloroflexi bacterium]|nr:phospholipid carrier-dependent glycosyltransferase [Chloroflexota bacterium]